MSSFRFLFWNFLISGKFQVMGPHYLKFKFTYIKICQTMDLDSTFSMIIMVIWSASRFFRHEKWIIRIVLRPDMFFEKCNLEWTCSRSNMWNDLTENKNEINMESSDGLFPSYHTFDWALTMTYRFFESSPSATPKIDPNLHTLT